MKYRTDNKSGNDLSILGMGCMRFPKDAEKTEKIILNAVDKGINYFDTAYMYPGSETVLGNILEKNKLREKVYIATKFPVLFCKSASDFDKFFEKQLDRLKTDYVDYYLMHSLQDVSRWKALCGMGVEEWIKTKKKEKRIRQIGFSFHGLKQEFIQLIDIFDWDFCMIQYNYSDENYQAGVTGLKRAAEKGMPVMVMEPLLGGKLATGLPAPAAEVFKNVDPGVSPAGWGLRWLWDQPEVTVVLSGMNSMKQLEENLAVAASAAPGMLSGDERGAFDRVKDIFNASYKIKCTGCNYCMPCPHGVNIPSCFSAYNAFHMIDKSTGRQQYLVSTGAVAPNQHFASLCRKCGKCEELCPQHIEIVNSLAVVKKKMEPFWFRPVFGAARKILRIKGVKS